MITVGSLFSGIGGIDLGLERAGMTVKWQSEIEPYSCRVLKKHWPDVPNLGDIKNIDWSQIEPVDLIAGGYPCQPFSLAGKREGTNDPRHLWPYFRNAISAIRPSYALLENVRGHLTMGGTNVIGDLAEIGYNCEWQIISAASVGAPHKRDRIIIVAYPSEQCEHGRGYFHGTPEVSERQTLQKQISGGHSSISNATCCNGRVKKSHCLPKIFRQTTEFREPVSSVRPQFNRWQDEPSVGRVANGVPYRVDRLRGLGNAVVPQVAELVGRMIMASLT
tara:strand:+ start:1354 stop:2184 length:831 start_codon:yes stop_codon:yes gene_type:complete